MNKLPVAVYGVSGNIPHSGFVVILKEENGDKLLPIFIGAAEANNIHLLLQGTKYMRPLSYDLFHNLLEMANANIEEVVVTNLKDNTFYAEISLITADGYKHEVDARPSDAIALAIKNKCPIFVNQSIMDEAGYYGKQQMGTDRTADDLELRIKNLSLRLADAIENENYEDAARIRDMILEIEQKENVDR